MKKNKLTFIIAASLLALSSLAGCNSEESSQEGPVDGGSSNITTSELINPSSDGGNNQSSDGDNSSSNTSQSSGGYSSSQGGGSSSQGGGSSSSSSSSSNASDSDSSSSSSSSSSSGGGDINTGWDSQKIDEVFNKHNATIFELPIISDTNITFDVEDTEVGGVDIVTISAGKVTAAMVQNYIIALKNLNYKVSLTTENNYIIKVFTNDGMYTLHLTYTPDSSPALMQIQFRLVLETSTYKDWPASSIANYLVDVDNDSVPAFANAYGYTVSINQGGYYQVIAHVDDGSESQAKDDYISKLTTEAGYVADGSFLDQPQFRSQNKEIHVAVGIDSTNSPGEVKILIQGIDEVETIWPEEEIAAAIISNIYGGETITDVIPELDVESAESCSVITNISGEFEIYIEGLASSLADFKDVFVKNNGWINATYYRYNQSQKGALVSPNKQLVADFEFDGDNISILISKYVAADLKVVGLNDGDSETDDWDYMNSGISYTDATDPAEQAAHLYDSQILFTFDVKAGDTFKISNGVDWYGYEDIPQADKPNESDFVTDSNKNIVAVKDGKVNLFLKDLNGNKSIFVAYKPVLLPWPSEQLSTIFGDVFTSIPEIENNKASFAITGEPEVDPVTNRKTVYITVTVPNANEAKADAISQLETNYNYSLDTVRNIYVSSDDGLPIIGFNSTDENHFVMYLTYMPPVAPEPDGYPTEDIASWLTSFRATDALPDIHLENVEYTTEINDEGLNVLVYTPTGSNTVDNIDEQLLAIFNDSENGFAENGSYIYSSLHGDFSVFINVGTDNVKITFYPSGRTSIYPSAKLAQYLEDITVAETLANFTLDNADYQWFWPTEDTAFATLEIHNVDYESSDYDDLLVSLASQLKTEGFVERYYDEFGADVLVSSNREYCLYLSTGSSWLDIDVINFADLENPATLIGNFILTPQTDSWIFDGGAIFYAYVWGGVYGEYEWIPVSYDDANGCFYLENIDDSATGLIIVRMDPAGEDNPNWSYKWNQTDDINIRSCDANIEIYIKPS